MKYLLFTLLALISASFGTVDTLEMPTALEGEIPFDLPAMASPPSFEWIDQEDSIWSMLYKGEHFNGKPTDVFAYYADPFTIKKGRRGNESYPGIILVHGGGGTAFRVWAKQWAEQGYAALAMDLSGSQPLPEEQQNHVWGTKSSRLANGGPEDSQENQFAINEPFTEQWQFHAVSNIIRAHSLLRSFDFVDQGDTFITGISWGGYLTCLVTGIDHRFKAAVPVYGSGFLHEDSYWTTNHILDSLDTIERNKWVKLWDPSQYIPNAEIPMLFINGTNDFAYYVESWDKSAGLAKKGHQLLKVGMKHSHKDGAEPKEIAAFFEQHLLNTPKFPAFENLQFDNGVLKARLTGDVEIQRALLIYTTDNGLNTQRNWEIIPVTIQQGTIEVFVPEKANLFYLNVISRDQLEVSSRIFII